ncbi:prepilin peptidase [Methylobacterium soli]|uniref:Prepilin peptidase n=2 Tax=Methylobacterium soli TaxID=553447 RepID=A0A6L3T0L5_9HYPH|nr:prepilin peptidase [Methylobacterium soli]
MPGLLADPLVAALLPLPLTLPIALIDLRRQIIPDRLNLALLGLGLGLAGLRAAQAPLAALAEGLAGAGLAAALLWGLRAAYGAWRGRTGLGLGDVKFVGAATAWIGLSGLPLMIFAASGSALVLIGLAALRGRTIGAATRLPFGPFLALGLHAALWAGGAGPDLP